MRSCLHYQHNELFIEGVALNKVAAEFGTPCYVYSRATLEDNWRAFNDAFSSVSHRICYAVKANGNLSILRLLAQLQSGFDIVSAGELTRVLAAGGNPKKIIFSGVGKQTSEIEQAIEAGIDCFNVESQPELERIHDIAKNRGIVVNIALRINPNVNPNTHSYISTGLKENKFGIDADEILPLCKKLSSMTSVKLTGLACHIGSQITQLPPFVAAIDFMLNIYQQLQAMNIPIKTIDIGGGLGIVYKDEEPPSVQDYARAILSKLASIPVEIIIEPGRAIVGNAGVLLTRVEYLKHNQHKNFAIVDAGMNDLLRPSLYQAWQNILPANLPSHDEPKKIYDIVGPVCESADFLGKDRKLALAATDLLAIDNAGAYGFSMSSNYNARCRPAEVLVDGDKCTLIRRRETLNELLASEVQL